MQTVLLLHAAVTWALTGLVWTVQVVQYPLFAGAGRDGFRAYHEAHCRRISFVVGPLMLAEAATGVALLLAPPTGIPAILPGVGFALLLLNWLSTAFVQVPLHGRLARGFARRPHRALVATNWIRTVAWSVRSGIVLAMLAAAGAGK
jgi:hypothetical protein